MTEIQYRGIIFFAIKFTQRGSTYLDSQKLDIFYLHSPKLHSATSTGLHEYFPTTGANAIFALYPLFILLGILFSLLAIEETKATPLYRRGAFWHGIISTLLAMGLISYLHQHFGFLTHYYYQGPSWDQPEAVFYLAFVWGLAPFLLGFFGGHYLRHQSVLGLAGTTLLTVGVQALVLWWFVQNSFSPPSINTGETSSLTSRSGLIALAWGGGLVLDYLLLVWYYWRKRWRNEETRPTPRTTFYPGQLRVVQAFCQHHFSPITPSDWQGGRKLAEKFSRFISSMPWINQVGLGLAVEIIQILPVVVLLRPKFFTSLTKEERDRFFHRIEHAPIAALFNLVLILKTTLSLLHYENEEVFDKCILAASPSEEEFPV